MRISDWSSDVCSSDLGDDGKIAGVQSYATNQVPNEAGTPETGVAILGDWSQVLLGVWSEIDILVNPYAQPAYGRGGVLRSEEHTSELQSLMRISYAVFCLKKKKQNNRPKLTN